MRGARGEEVRVFAPATVSNLGSGFDILGLAVRGPGDTVVARRRPGTGVRIARIEGDGGALPRDPEANTAAIAAAAVLHRAGIGAGVELELHKGMPIGTGLGSSAASAAAAALAVNLLVGSPLRKVDLVGACVEAEATVAGRHADNVAPALLGGLVLVRSADPPDLVRIPVPEGLVMVVVTPAFSLSTREARAVLPEAVPLREMVRNSANVASLLAGCYAGDLAFFGRGVTDHVITPVRARLIPGCEAVIAAALAAGALGSSISGAGPSVFALSHSPRRAERIARAMVAAFRDAGGVDASFLVSPADAPGARRV
ncbi:MAG TPA: homoserine kinase [Longimicrobiaceae bacterium]|nr:homoserine kinase [Longimicrobiaceae bacterium]